MHVAKTTETITHCYDGKFLFVEPELCPAIEESGHSLLAVAMGNQGFWFGPHTT